MAEVSSSLNLREKWTIPESNFITLQGIPTHTLGNFPFRATIPLIFRGVDQGHHKRLQDRTHIQCAGHTSTAWLYDCTPICYAECTPTCWCMCATKTIIRVVGYVHLPGQSGTRLTAYHMYGMWLVLSYTWPPLPHTAALSNWSTQMGTIPSHGTTHNSVCDPYSDCKIVNNQLLYRASDRKSLDFCRSY
jgi:hypothetical protein